MKRLLGITAFTGIMAMAMAFGPFGKVFEDTYKVKDGSNLDKAKCGVCHVSAKGGKLNPYGTDMQAEMKKAGTKKLTPAVLKELEGMDSDKDGKKNGEEIKSDGHPGVK
jgi:hypothetical protein